MVLVAAAVCTKSGKAIVSRQFVEMSKARIEGLLAAFPKLKDSGKQHTFVETDSVRYVYQPLDLLYMLLITTKASNILEDLETLRLFSKVVPEYCRSLDEADISSNAFSLIYAFDEIVALGYRESVNLAQIRTFVEMDSHEEKVYKAVRETQEREAKIKMKEKAKELQRKKYEESRGLSGRGSTAIYGSGGNSSGYPSTSSSTLSLQANDMKPRSQESRPALPKASSKAMKLGSKSRDVDSFLGALQQEGETVSSAKVDAARKADAPQHSEPIHVLVHEELLVKAGRDGSLRSLEVQGILKLCINDPEYSLIRVQMENSDTRGIQFQTNPNVDRELWRSCSQIGMKQADKPFPAKTEIGVLRWRFKTSQGEHIPLAINCWPQEDGSGGCDVNIEYTLEQTELELRDVSIQVPLMAGAPPPQVSTCDGEHKHDRAHGCLVWSIPLLDASNPSGSLEFSARGGADIFFPVKVAFSSTTSFCSLKVGSIVSADDSKPQPYSVDYELATTDYQID